MPETNYINFHMWFQQDGATVHTARESSTYQNTFLKSIDFVFWQNALIA